MTMQGALKLKRKSFWDFSEVCALYDLKPYVLSYWEKEFTQIAAVTTDIGKKQFSYDDVQTIGKIKELVIEQSLSLRKAKKELQAQTSPTQNRPAVEKKTQLSVVQEAEDSVVDFRKELVDLRAELLELKEFVTAEKRNNLL